MARPGSPAGRQHSKNTKCVAVPRRALPNGSEWRRGNSLRRAVPPASHQEGLQYHRGFRGDRMRFATYSPANRISCAWSEATSDKLFTIDSQLKALVSQDNL